jgi:hypothetical protein
MPAALRVLVLVAAHQSCGVLSELRTPPPSFASKAKKMDKVDGPDAENSEWIKLEFLMEPDNPASKYS